MEKFKVICKADDSIPWETLPRISKVITTSKFFGLLKSSKIVQQQRIIHGPAKDEICIVTGTFTNPNGFYYELAGYPYGGYNAKHFIRLDEFTETQKEIAQKFEEIPN